MHGCAIHQSVRRRYRRKDRREPSVQWAHIDIAATMEVRLNQIMCTQAQTRLHCSKEPPLSFCAFIVSFDR